MIEAAGTKYEYDNDKHIKMLETVLVLNRGLSEEKLPQYTIIMIDEPNDLIFEEDGSLKPYAKGKVAFALSQEAVTTGGATYVDINSSHCVDGGDMERYADDDVNVYPEGVVIIVAPDKLEEILIEKGYAVPVKRNMDV